MKNTMNLMHRIKHNVDSQAADVQTSVAFYPHAGCCQARLS